MQFDDLSCIQSKDSREYSRETLYMYSSLSFFAALNATQQLVCERYAPPSNRVRQRPENVSDAHKAAIRCE